MLLIGGIGSNHISTRYVGITAGPRDQNVQDYSTIFTGRKGMLSIAFSE